MARGLQFCHHDERMKRSLKCAINAWNGTLGSKMVLSCESTLFKERFITLSQDRAFWREKSFIRDDESMLLSHKRRKETLSFLWWEPFYAKFSIPFCRTLILWDIHTYYGLFYRHTFKCCVGTSSIHGKSPFWKNTTTMCVSLLLRNRILHSCFEKVKQVRTYVSERLTTYLS